METEVPTAKEARGKETAPPTGWRVAGAILLTIGVVAGAVAVYLLERRGSSAEAIWLWLFALAALPVGLNFGVSDPLHLARPKANRELAAVLGILALATVIQIALPPESRIADQSSPVELSSILRGEVRNLFAPGPSGLSPLSYWVALPLATMVGGAALAVRWGAAIEGLASILLLYLVARRVVPFIAAAVGALLLALTPWHIQTSQGGLFEMQLLVGPLLLFYLLLRAIDSRRPIEYLLTGYAGGLCLTLTQAPLVGPMAALLYLLFRAIREPAFMRRQGVMLLLSGAGVILFASPFLA